MPKMWKGIVVTLISSVCVPLRSQTVMVDAYDHILSRKQIEGWQVEYHSRLYGSEHHTLKCNISKNGVQIMIVNSHFYKIDFVHHLYPRDSDLANDDLKSIQVDGKVFDAAYIRPKAVNGDQGDISFEDGNIEFKDERNSSVNIKKLYRILLGGTNLVEKFSRVESSNFIIFEVSLKGIMQADQWCRHKISRR